MSDETQADGDERIFHCVGDGACKFWCVSLAGNVQTVRWGRIGTVGQSLLRNFESAAKAADATERLVAAKRLRGYVERTAEEARSVSPAPPPARPRRVRTPAYQLPLPFDAPPLPSAGRETLSLGF